MFNVGDHVVLVDYEYIREFEGHKGHIVSIENRYMNMKFSPPIVCSDGSGEVTYLAVFAKEIRLIDDSDLGIDNSFAWFYK